MFSSWCLLWSRAWQNQTNGQRVWKSLQNICNSFCLPLGDQSYPAHREVAEVRGYPVPHTFCPISAPRASEISIMQLETHVSVHRRDGTDSCVRSALGRRVHSGWREDSEAAETRVVSGTSVTSTLLCQPPRWIKQKEIRTMHTSRHVHRYVYIQTCIQMDSTHLLSLQASDYIKKNDKEKVTEKSTS